MGGVGKRTLGALRTSGPLWTAGLILDRVLPFGLLGLWPDRMVPAGELERFVRAVLTAWGMPADHVAVTVDHLLYADLRAIDSHGSSMLVHYHHALRSGAITAHPLVEVVSEGPTTALIDGGGGLGHAPGDAAMRLAIDKCRHTGVAAVAVRNSGHFGAAGAYAAMASNEGLLGMVTTSTEAPAVVPTFGSEAMLGTNALSFAAPGPSGETGFLLDMATSTASLGRLVTAWRKGRRIPRGWALGRRGRSVRNGRRAARDRRLTPLGGTPAGSSHKGYGLAATVEVLSALLPGGSGRDTWTPSRRPGHFFLAIDPERFRGPGEFGADLEAMARGLRAARPTRADRPVLVAGDLERAARAERGEAGIPMSRSAIEDLRAVASQSGVPFELYHPA